MITVAIFINGKPIAARTAVNVGRLATDVWEYRVDDGTSIRHNPSDGAVVLAIKMLKTIKEVGAAHGSEKVEI